MERKVAYITGGSKGIGYAVAAALLEQGYHVAISSRSQEAAEQAKSQLGDGERILAIQSDVRTLVNEQNAIQKVVEQFGQLDVLIANAGVGHFSHIEDLSPQQWNDVIDINLTGVYHSVKASIPELKKTKGYIITIASLAGTNFFAGGSAYNASKFGLVGFTQAIMLDLRHEGIKVSTVMPGSVSTEFNNRTPSPADAWKIQPEDIGQIVVDLLNMPARTLPSKVEVRPSVPPRK